MLDLAVDGHVHTAFSAGRDSVSVLVAAAEEAGLRELVLADQAGPESPWLPMYLASIRRAQRRTELTLRAGVEVQVVAVDGWMGFPADLGGGLEVVAVAVDRLPLPAGPADAATVRALLDAGTLRPADVVETLIGVTSRALDRVARYAPPRLVRPLELLERVGLDASVVEPAAVTALADACRGAGAVIEVSERHRTPGSRLAQALAAAGAKLVPASDGRCAADVGQWRYVAEAAGVWSPVAAGGAVAAG
jgi:putative hydrolase